VVAARDPKASNHFHHGKGNCAQKNVSWKRAKGMILREKQREGGSRSFLAKEWTNHIEKR